MKSTNRGFRSFPPAAWGACVLMGLLGVASGSLAQDAEVGEKLRQDITDTEEAMEEASDRGWSGEGELGYSQTSGNTETQSLTARLTVQQQSVAWQHALGFDALNTSDTDGTTAERYQVDARSAYKFGGARRNFGFVAVRYVRDRFSGFEYQVSETLGLGRTVLDNDRTQLAVELGVGARQSETIDDETENELIGRGALRLGQSLTESTRLTQDLAVEVGDTNTYGESRSGLKVSINDQLALKLAYAVNYNSGVAEDVDEFDTQTSVTVVYGF